MPESFTCPRCGRTSVNPNDVRERYCGNCHDWTGISEFAFHCNACDHRESWTSEEAAQASSVWHVYLAHPELWYPMLAAKGEAFRDPQCPMPETLGRRFEMWESQL